MNSWWSLGLARTEQNSAGVYELGDDSENVVYIGSSTAIRDRLMAHENSDDPCIRRYARKYRVEYTRNCREEERRRYDEFVRVHGRPPICNDRRP